jgi:hypothetical protein
MKHLLSHGNVRRMREMNRIKSQSCDSKREATNELQEVAVLLFVWCGRDYRNNLHLSEHICTEKGIEHDSLSA